MRKIVTFLWFDDQAEAAAEFYTSVFPNSKITDVQRYGEAGPGAAGSVMVVTFELDGQEYMALNGGPRFTFSEAISLYVRCETQDEVDELWEKLSEGGEKGPCGWLKETRPDPRPCAGGSMRNGGDERVQFRDRQPVAGADLRDHRFSDVRDPAMIFA